MAGWATPPASEEHRRQTSVMLYDNEGDDEVG